MRSSTLFYRDPAYVAGLRAGTITYPDPTYTDNLRSGVMHHFADDGGDLAVYAAALAVLPTAEVNWYDVVSASGVEDAVAVNAAQAEQYGYGIGWYNATLGFVEAFLGENPLLPEYRQGLDVAEENYTTARRFWLTVVGNNTGATLVAKRRKAYEAATAAFEAAQKALSANLEDGSVPPGILAQWQAMTEAEVRWRDADRNYREMLLIKTERVKQAQELRNKLRAFVADDGKPIEQLVNAWCADATEELAADTVVASIEIPGERLLGVRVRPGYNAERYGYIALRDGKLQPSWASSPEATFYNWAIHPGAERWKPRYRLGKILFVDQTANTAIVELDPQQNSHASKGHAYEATTLELNNPVKYVINPDTGGQEAVLPGPNVTGRRWRHHADRCAHRVHGLQRAGVRSGRPRAGGIPQPRLDQPEDHRLCGTPEALQHAGRGAVRETARHDGYGIFAGSEWRPVAPVFPPGRRHAGGGQYRLGLDR